MPLGASTPTRENRSALYLELYELKGRAGASCPGPTLLQLSVDLGDVHLFRHRYPVVIGVADAAWEFDFRLGHVAIGDLL